jgi:glycosyltransferase involved in cell wall biosynthesis
MKQLMKNYDMNIFLSNNYRDIDFAKKNKIKNRLIIPNGASREEFNQKNKYNIRKLFDIKKDTFLILSIGSHTHLKGHKEAIKIFANANLDNSALLIIGNVLDKNNCFSECKTHAQKFNKKQSSRLKNKKIIIADMLDRKKTIDAYKQSDLFFLPSNIECSPIVLFEAMAAKLPFLSTDCGNAKEIITWSHGGMILPSAKIPLYKKLLCPYISVIADINGSAKILEKIRYNKELSSNLAKNGHSAWLKRFTWEKIAKQYEELYLDLLNNHNDPV